MRNGHIQGNPRGPRGSKGFKRLVSQIAYILLAGVVTFWPVAYFRSELALDIPLFTTEWLKLVLGGMVLFAAVEIVLHNQREHAIEQVLQRVVSFEIAGPLRDAARYLVSAQDAVRADVHFNPTELCRQLRLVFNRVRAALYQAPLIATSSHTVLATRQFADTFSTYDWELRVDEFSAIDEWRAANIEELSSMRNIVDDLVRQADLLTS